MINPIQLGNDVADFKGETEVDNFNFGTSILHRRTSNRFHEERIVYTACNANGCHGADYDSAPWSWPLNGVATEFRGTGRLTSLPGYTPVVIPAVGPLSILIGSEKVMFSRSQINSIGTLPQTTLDALRNSVPNLNDYLWAKAVKFFVTPKVGVLVRYGTVNEFSSGSLVAEKRSAIIYRCHPGTDPRQIPSDEDIRSLLSQVANLYSDRKKPLDDDLDPSTHQIYGRTVAMVSDTKCH